MGSTTELLLVAVLVASVATDLRSHRIPNVIIVLGVGGAFALAGAGGWPKLGLAAAGFATGLVLFLPCYALAWMGAGDVKLMAVVGAFLGPLNTVLAAVAVLICGGAVGLMWVVCRGGGAAMLRRYWEMLQCICRTGRCAYVPPAESEVAGKEMPFALAIALGTGWTLWQTGTILSPSSLLIGGGP